jgi:hypothetical protein
MERSVIRVRSTSFNAHPGFRFAHPGYNPSLRLASGKERKEMERRQTHTVMPARNGARGAPRKGGLRRPSASGALACRRSTAVLPKGCVVPWCDPGQASWVLCHRGGYDRRLGTHFQRRTPHAGHSAGRLDARTAREPADEAGPRVPHSPPALRHHPESVLHGARFVTVCTYSRDICQGHTSEKVTTTRPWLWMRVCKT